MDNLDTQSLITLVIWFCTMVGMVYQMRNDTRRNKEAIEDLKEVIEKNSQETRDILNNYKDNQKESLEREINHLKDLLEVNSRETRADIQKLESAQRESNKIKERLAIAEASLKSLHKRLDIKPPSLIDINRDDD